MPIRVIVCGENVNEQVNEIVAGLYPKGIHRCIAATLYVDTCGVAVTANLQDSEHGLSDARLARTGVLLWWGHASHDDVDDAPNRPVNDALEKIAERGPTLHKSGKLGVR